MRKALAAVVLLATSACSAQGGVRVTLDEYSISVRPESEQAGIVSFTAHNIGSIAHQLQVLRTELDADDLPIAKGVVVLDDEDIEVVEEISIIANDETETVSATLEQGPHVLICNIAGHYDNGMWAAFEVD